MDDKNKKLMVAQEELKAKINEIARQGSIDGAYELAKLANVPYDAEVEIPEVISEIAKTDSVAKGEDYEYFTVSPETKRVYTVSDGSVTQTAVTPGSENDLSFDTYDSDEYYVYIEKLLAAKYDALKIKADASMESLDRLEVKTVLDLLITAAEGQSNTFANDSSDDAIDFEKLVEIVRSLAKYGSKLVLISGSNVTTDLMLMDYNDDKNREVSVEKAQISKWIKLEDFTYTHSTSQTVFDADKALIIATSDAANQRPVHFVRRKVTSIDGATEKERVVVVAGPGHFVGASRKLAYSTVAFEQFGAVVTNPYAIAVYKNDSSYS